MAEKNSVPWWLSFAFLFFVLSIANLTLAQTWGNPVWSDEFNGSQNAAPDSHQVDLRHRQSRRQQ